MGCRPDLAEVAVWWMEIGSPPAPVVARWRACLDAAEQAKADRFHFEVDRTTYVAAHWLVRNALASVGGLPPSDWRFIAGKHGKPGIDPTLAHPGLQFNLSHTRGFVGCAVSFGDMIGIDVEALSRKIADLDVAERFFSPAEVAILRGTVQDQQSDTFLRFWTLKEAFIKATGEGLSRALESFSFVFDPISIRFDPEDGGEAAQWKFIQQRPTPRHLLALAIRHSPSRRLKLSFCPVQPDGEPPVKVC
jgi:4'-phosphopantetheinyl transferase